MRSQPQIETLRLRLYSNDLGRNGYVALGNALEGCVSLRELDLIALDNDGRNGGLIHNEGLNALAAGLKHCHNLTSLDLDGSMMMTEEVSRSLSTLFQSGNCRLERLDLNNKNIDDDGMAVFATGLASLSSLKWLHLEGMSISDQGLQDLARGLLHCNIEASLHW